MAKSEAHGATLRRFSVLRVIAQVGIAEWGEARAPSITDIGPPSQNTRRGHPPRRYEEGRSEESEDGLKRQFRSNGRLTRSVRRW